MDAMLEALGARGRGSISREDLAMSAQLDVELGHRKTAGPVLSELLGALRPTPVVAKEIGEGITRAGALYALGLGAHGTVKGIGAAVDALTKGRDLKRILQAYPKIEKEYPPEEIELAYNSVRHMNPHVAKDPLAGGTVLMQILHDRDAMDPKASPRFQTDLALNLLRLRPDDKGIGSEIARDALTVGMQQGYRMGDQARQQEFMHGEGLLDRGDRASQFKTQQELRKEDFTEKVRQYKESRTDREKELEKEHQRRVQIELGKAYEQTGRAREEQKALDRREALKALLHNVGPDEYREIDATGQWAVDSKGDPVYTSRPQVGEYLTGSWPHPLMDTYFRHLRK